MSRQHAADFGCAAVWAASHGEPFDVGGGRGVEEARKPEPPDHAATHPLCERSQVSLGDRSGGQERRRGVTAWDLDVAGERFRTGDVVGLLLGSANRDAAKFAEPDAFVAGRRPNPHVSLGAGIHACVGAPLARLEMQVALWVLFERLPRLALAEPPVFRNARHFRGVNALVTA